MRALLLAAGYGTRLRPLTDVLPKCLMPINGVPLLAYWLRLLREAGISEVLINTHHLAELVNEYVLAAGITPVPRIVHEPELLQTGGSLLHNRSFFGDEPAMVIHADNLSCPPMKEFTQAFERRPAGIAMTMLTKTRGADD